MTTGLLLVNLGTPDAPDTASVRRYLREFLSDPRVIDIPAPLRWLLLNAVILPTRPRVSAEAYRKVWTAQGSPLLVHSLALRDAVRARLGENWRVELGMRYGRPSLQDALAQLKAAGACRIVVAPLYPQYASSSTGSSLEHLYRLNAAHEDVAALSVLPAFFDDPGFLTAWHDVAAPILQRGTHDHVLFSFHGLPERQVKKADATGAHCLQSSECCERPNAVVEPYCYRRQAFATARGLARKLGLDGAHWSVAFQSRLGRTPWLRPFTDVHVVELAQKGVRKLAVVCPSFVADCLETVEEVAMRVRETFVHAGGESLTLVPSLNASPAWVDWVARAAQALAPE